MKVAKKTFWSNLEGGEDDDANIVFPANFPVSNDGKTRHTHKWKKVVRD